MEKIRGRKLSRSRAGSLASGYGSRFKLMRDDSICSNLSMCSNLSGCSEFSIDPAVKEDANKTCQKMDELEEDIENIRRSVDEIDDEFALYNKNLNPNVFKMTFPSFDMSSNENSSSLSMSGNSRVANPLRTHHRKTAADTDKEVEDVSSRRSSFYVGHLSDTSAGDTDADFSLEWDSPSSQTRRHEMKSSFPSSPAWSSNEDLRAAPDCQLLQTTQLLPNHTCLELNMELELQQTSFASSNEGASTAQPNKLFLGAQALRLAQDACLEAPANQVFYTPRRRPRSSTKKELATSQVEGNRSKSQDNHFKSRLSDANYSPYKQGKIENRESLNQNLLTIAADNEGNYLPITEKTQHKNGKPERKRYNSPACIDFTTCSENKNNISSHYLENELFEDQNANSSLCDNKRILSYSDAFDEGDIKTSKSMTSSIDSAFVDASPSMISSAEFFDDINSPHCDDSLRALPREPKNGFNIDELDEILIEQLSDQSTKVYNRGCIKSNPPKPLDAADPMTISTDSAIYTEPNTPRYQSTAASLSSYRHGRGVARRCSH